MVIHGPAACAICQKPFDKCYASQRACSRSCGAKLSCRIQKDRNDKEMVVRCDVCGVVYRKATRAQKTCGKPSCATASRTRAHKREMKLRIELMTREMFAKLSKREIDIFNHAMHLGYKRGFSVARHRYAPAVLTHRAITPDAWSQPR